MSYRSKIIVAFALFFGFVFSDTFFLSELHMLEGFEGERYFSKQEFVQTSKMTKQERILKISDIHEPRIDDVAAMTDMNENVYPPVSNALLQKNAVMWVWALVSYCALLIVNLYYGWKKIGVPEWFWECVYMFSMLFIWYVFDATHANIWFPLYVLKLSIAIYSVYLLVVSYIKGKEVSCEK